MNKELDIYTALRHTVTTGDRTADRMEMIEKIGTISVDLNEIEVRLCNGITAIGVTQPNEKGTRSVHAIVGGMFQMLAFDSPITPNAFGGVSGGTRLSRIPYTRTNPETNEMIIVKGTTNNRVIQLNRWNACKADEQGILESGLIKIASGAINFMKENTKAKPEAAPAPAASAAGSKRSKPAA